MKENNYIRAIDALFVTGELLQKEILDPEKSIYDSKKALSAWKVIQELRQKIEDLPVEEKANFKLF